MKISKIAIDTAEKILAVTMSKRDAAAYVYVQHAIDEAMPAFTAHHYVRCECGRDVKVTVVTEGGCIWVDGHEVGIQVKENPDGDKQDCEEVGT